jgi:hypothetical protein
MTPHQLAETVLFQVECFMILQELDHEAQSANTDARRFLDRQYPNIDHDQRNFFDIKTVLATLLIPICFLDKSNEEEINACFHPIDEYGVSFFRDGAQAEATPKGVLHVVRNALAHLPDFAAAQRGPNVSFPENVVVRLSSRVRRQRHDVVFQQEDGFVRFVGDVVRAARANTSALIGQEGVRC